MSDDLISKSALMEDFRNTITENSDTFDWLNMISRQPNAYDVNKVVERLENAKKNFVGMGTLQSAYFDKGIDKAIEIVKSCGVADD